MFYSSSYQYLSSETEYSKAFGGYCHRGVINNGQWFDMTNMSGRKYPSVCTRPQRQILSKVAGEAVSNVAAMVDMDGLVWLGKDGSLHAGGHCLENFYTWTEADRQLIPMGGYLIVFPDKVWANAVKLRLGGDMVKDTDYGSLEAKWEQDIYPVAMCPCNEHGELWLYVPPGFTVVDDPNPFAEYEYEKYINVSSYPYVKWEPTETVENGQAVVKKMAGLYFGYHISAQSPQNPGNGFLWMDVSGDKPTMKRWSESTKMWSAETPYMRIYSIEWDESNTITGFGVGDSVTIEMPGVFFDYESYVPSETGEGYYAPRKNINGRLLENAQIAATGKSIILIDQTVLAFYEARYIVVKGYLDSHIVSLNYHNQLVRCALYAQHRQKDPTIIETMTERQLAMLADDELKARIDGMTDEKNGFSYEALGLISAKRYVHDMDYVTECGNRLWGCFYGEKDGKILNEIYASKLGDFKNWNSFQGLSTDSYAASRGTDGPWTGAITMNNYPLFFKRNYLEKIYISASGAHQITTTRMPGVQPGSWRSMQIIDGVLYYLSDSGVMTYDGSLPDCISSDLGEEKYKAGVGGKLGNCYYLSALGADGKPDLFVYDKSKGFWHREDETRALQMADRGDVLYQLLEDGSLISPGAAAEEDTATGETDFTWELVTGCIGYERPEQEYLKRLSIRMKLELGASAVVHVQYDDGPWQRVATVEGNATKTTDVPVKPRRCDHFRIRISGIGEATIISIAREIEKGSVLV